MSIKLTFRHRQLKQIQITYGRDSHRLPRILAMHIKFMFNFSYEQNVRTKIGGQVCIKWNPLYEAAKQKLINYKNGESYICHKNLANIIHRPHSLPSKAIVENRN